VRHSAARPLGIEVRSRINRRAAGPANPVVVTTRGSGARGCDNHGVRRELPAGRGLPGGAPYRVYRTLLPGAQVQARSKSQQPSTTRRKLGLLYFLERSPDLWL
jgi:hypothetical protein